MLAGAYFTTESYPDYQRSQVWRETLARLSLRLAKPSAGEDTHGVVSSIVSPQGLTFAAISSGAQEISFANDARDKFILILLHREGPAVLLDDARESPIAPGDIVYCPPGATGRLALRGRFRQLLVRIPQDALRMRLPTPLFQDVGRLPGDTGSGHIFAGMLASVADMIDTLTSEQLRPVELALSELLVSSLADLEASSVMMGATATQTSNLHRITLHVEARLSNPDLSITSVAQDVGVSPRYLQKLFESAGENFSHYLRLRRLERCRADLINPLYSHLSITDICFRWSFNDAAHFSRAFREQYGMSPRTYRREIGHKIADNVLLHMTRGWPERASDELKKHKHAELPKSALEPAIAVHGAVSPQKADNDAASDSANDLCHYHLPATASTVHWGYFSRLLKPVLEVQSGDCVTIETLTHHAYDDYDRMIAGDSGAESVFRWTAEGKGVDRRGAGPADASIFGRGSGEGFGVHICTGPIGIKDAQPGDVLEVRILDVHPRLSANPDYAGLTFGSNAATWWGFHYGELLTEPKQREVVTIYEVDCRDGKNLARALYNYRWVPQVDPYGVVHPTIDYPGIPVDHTRIQKNFGILKDIHIPVVPHFGVMALAPREADIVDSIPPAYFGGNIDNRRLGKGATMYLPVSVPGALFSVGDPHASQGDAELCGTAIECSLTGVFQLILHKKRDLAGKPFADLSYPLLETPDEWVIHGFSYSNYLAELGHMAQSEIYKKSSLDNAMKDAFRKMRRFLMSAKGLSEDEAISLMSVAIDFGVTQVVDGNWCVHAVLKKSLFVSQSGIAP